MTATTGEIAKDNQVNQARMVDGVIPYTGPIDHEDAPAAPGEGEAPTRRFSTRTRVLGGENLPGHVQSPVGEGASEDEGIPRQFPAARTGAATDVEDDGEHEGSYDEEEEDELPPPPPDPKPPRRGSGGRGKGGAGGPKNTREAQQTSAYDRAKAHLSPERQAKLDDLRAEWGEGKDSILFKMVEALSFSEQFFVSIPQQLRDSVREVVDQAVMRIAESLSTIDVEQLSNNIAETTIARLWKRINTRTIWAVVSAAAFALFVLGGVSGAALTAGYYREQYEKQLSAIPHITNSMRTATGRSLMELTNVNSDYPISLIASCDSRAGLHLVQAQYGGKVCIGTSDATSGWRIKD